MERAMNLGATDFIIKSNIELSELVEKIKSFNRKVIILGDMLELGKDKIKLHCALSSIVIKCGIDEVYTIEGSNVTANWDAISK